MEPPPPVRPSRARRLIPLAAALLVAALLAITAGDTALAQGPPDEPVLVNAGEKFIERKDDGSFIARPVFDRQVADLYYGIRHPDTGEWIGAVYKLHGGEKRLREGWEYTFEYPVIDRQPELDPDSAYLITLLVSETAGGVRQSFHAVIPVHQPGGLWERVLGALDPGRWARAFARWIVEGVHGTLCGVIERAGGEDAGDCEAV